MNNLRMSKVLQDRDLIRLNSAYRKENGMPLLYRTTTTIRPAKVVRTRSELRKSLGTFS